MFARALTGCLCIRSTRANVQYVQVLEVRDGPRGRGGPAPTRVRGEGANLSRHGGEGEVRLRSPVPSERTGGLCGTRRSVRLCINQSQRQRFSSAAGRAGHFLV